MNRWTEAQKARRREASQRWRDRNPEKVAAANKKPRYRIYDAVKTKAWRQRRLLKPDYRDTVNRQANERAIKIRRWLDSYKLECGCRDCGYRKHPHALHFDHARDKAFNVCNAKSIAQAKREITKCVVRCANCHAIKTHDRRLAHKSAEKSGLCMDKARL